MMQGTLRGGVLLTYAVVLSAASDLRHVGEASPVEPLSPVRSVARLGNDSKLTGSRPVRSA